MIGRLFLDAAIAVFGFNSDDAIADGATNVGFAAVGVALFRLRIDAVFFEDVPKSGAFKTTSLAIGQFSCFLLSIRNRAQYFEDGGETKPMDAPAF